MMQEMSYLKLWYEKAQVDYAQQYMVLYVAFNAWYRINTGKAHDRVALNILRRGHPLWERYCRGEKLGALITPMTHLVEYSQREPLPHATPHWDGEVKTIQDWPSLLEYWYRVRCLLVHGALVSSRSIYLAYETLNIFMGEVIRTQRS